MAANNKMAFALGMAQKAGKAASGDLAVKATLKSGRACVLIVAADVAENTKKELLYVAEQAGVPVVTGPDRAGLGLAIGKAPRAAVAITDSNFAKMLMK